ncbi:MAG: transposase [Thermodesulfobacteriota bacterium]
MNRRHQAKRPDSPSLDHKSSGEACCIGADEKAKRIQDIQAWLKNKTMGNIQLLEFRFPDLMELPKEAIKGIGFSRRRLPHWELEGATYFITFRTDSKIGPLFHPNPPKCQDVAKTVGQAFQPAGPQEAPALSNPYADILEESIWFWYGLRYTFDAYVIMPDHVHLLARPLKNEKLSSIMKSLKGFTARKINRLLKRRGGLLAGRKFRPYNSVQGGLAT